jgi:c(7)-type cytochrome triheme protein
MHRSLFRTTRASRARFALALGALAAALLAGSVRPVGAPAGSAAMQEAPQEPAKETAEEDEEHGGDIVFHVVSRTQKYSVVYSHDAHIAAGIECEECHDKPFEKVLGKNRFKMADINRGQYCGVCHNETPDASVKHPAFAPKKNCEKCHHFRVRDPIPK